MEITKVANKSPLPFEESFYYEARGMKFRTMEAAERYAKYMVISEAYGKIPKKLFINKNSDITNWYYVTSPEDLLTIGTFKYVEIEVSKQIKYPTWVGLFIPCSDCRYIDDLYLLEDFKADALLMHNFVAELESFDEEEKPL